MHAHVCMHTCTYMEVAPDSPNPPQKISSPTPITSKVMAHYVFYVKSNMYPMQSKCKTYRGYPPTSHKKFQCPITITKKDIAHYTFGCKTPYVLIAKVMQTHEYVHIWHNVSTSKFECPAKVLIQTKPIMENWNIFM